jgi:hypothetical protein
MHYSKVGNTLREKIHEFSGKLSPHFSKPTSRFVEQVIYGITVSQDVKLSKIGRALEEDIPLKKTVNRLSVNLDKEGLASELQEQIIQNACHKVHQNTLLIVDPSDLRKEYAKKMENLGTVRDGSSDELCNGYWMMNIIGCEAGGHRITPIYQSLYSSSAPDFDSENSEILSAVDKISSQTNKRGILVIDRGGDRHKLIKPFIDKKLRFIIRMRGDRHLVFRGRPRKVTDLSKGCPLWYRESIVKEEKGKEKTYHLEYGFREVRMPGRDEKLWLVVVTGFGKKPLMLLTNIPQRKNRKGLWFIIDGYLTRWRIEEAIRFTKQSYNLEDIRLLTYRRLCNMITLVLAASYFAAVYLGERLKLAVLTGRVLKAAKRFYGIASFRYYAIADGMAYILRRLGKGPIAPSPVVISDKQLEFSLAP